MLDDVPRVFFITGWILEASESLTCFVILAPSELCFRVPIVFSFRMLALLSLPNSPAGFMDIFIEFLAYLYISMHHSDPKVFASKAGRARAQERSKLMTNADQSIQRKRLEANGRHGGCWGSKA